MTQASKQTYWYKAQRIHSDPEDSMKPREQSVAATVWAKRIVSSDPWQMGATVGRFSQTVFTSR